MDYEIVDENLIWTEEGYGNSAAINLGGKIIVIDAMFNWELTKEWRKLIEQHFNAPPIAGLVLTHHHADHTFGNQVFSDLPIISSLKIRKIMRHFEQEVWLNKTPKDLAEWEAGGYGVKGLQITHANLCFENKIQLYGERELEVIQADGHTGGSSYLWEPETKTLIAGDLVFNKQFPYGGDDTCNPIIWQTVMKRLIDLKPKTIISGHGPPASNKDLIEINNFFLKGINFIRKKLYEGSNFQEIADDPNFPEYYSQDRAERKRVTIERWVEFFKKKSNKKIGKRK
ncbi:MAG: MBL fold metallo-hydrolase [Candidatus Hodarchaeales archaeon]|jgi:glyoxylase-like metal-dependent hydrolase (beta-lactamase superfamily II)